MKIKYFAWIKDITNKENEIIESDFPKNIDELKILLGELYPELKIHLSEETLRFAINLEYSSINEKLSSSDEIAVFPPVSGG